MTLSPTLIRNLVKNELQTLGKEAVAQKGKLREIESFEEFYKDVTHSDSICNYLMATMSSAIMGIPGIAKSSQKLADLEDRTGQFHNVIDENIGVFSSPLALLYIGIRVGRQLEKEEMSLLKSLDLNIDPDEPKS